MTGYAGSLDGFRESTGDVPDLQNETRRDDLLAWLNSWGCRIAARDLPAVSKRLATWHRDATERNLLPERAARLNEVDNAYLETRGKEFADLFDSLINVMRKGRRRGHSLRFGPTATAKTLFALRPYFFPAWDQAMRDLHLRSGEAYDGSGESYVRFLKDVRLELRATARLCKKPIPSLDGLPKALDRPAYTTPVQLMAEYYWVFLTKRVHLPCDEQRRTWVRWSQTAKPTRQSRSRED